MAAAAIWLHPLSNLPPINGSIIPPLSDTSYSTKNTLACASVVVVALNGVILVLIKGCFFETFVRSVILQAWKSTICNFLDCCAPDLIIFSSNCYRWSQPIKTMSPSFSSKIGSTLLCKKWKVICSINAIISLNLWWMPSWSQCNMVNALRDYCSGNCVQLWGENENVSFSLWSVLSFSSVPSWWSLESLKGSFSEQKYTI